MMFGRVVTKRRLLAVVAVAVIEAWLGVSTFAAAFALGEARQAIPTWLKFAATVLNVPGLLLTGPWLQSVLGDPAEIYVAAALNGLLWGTVTVASAVWLRYRLAWHRRGVVA